MARVGEDGAVEAQTSKQDDSRQQVIKSHPELYHYTNAAGLKGIVESNSFWATYFGDLNDAQEIHALRVPLVDELAERLNRVVREARLRKPPRDSAVWKLISVQRRSRLAQRDRCSPYHTLRTLGYPIYPRYPYLPKGAKGAENDGSTSVSVN